MVGDKSASSITRVDSVAGSGLGHTFLAPLLLLPHNPLLLQTGAAYKAQWDSVLNQFTKRLKPLRLPDLYACSPSELDGCIATITDAQKKAAAIRPWLSQVWRLFPDLDRPIDNASNRAETHRLHR